MARYDDDDDDNDQPVMTLDQIFGPVPETVEQPTHYYGNDFSNQMSNTVNEVSKSQRVRDFLEENPEARNRDIVEALGQYGVTAADVSNAKAHLKRKGGTPAGKRSKSAAPAASASTPSASVKAAAAAAQDAAGGSIAMGELEAAITFVRQIGSIDRAQHLLVIIQQVQKL